MPQLPVAAARRLMSLSETLPVINMSSQMVSGSDLGTSDAKNPLQSYKFGVVYVNERPTLMILAISQITHQQKM